MLKIILAGLLVPLVALGRPALDPLRPAMERAVARVKPSLVRIQVVWVDYSEGREIKQQASGSGFIINKQGYVVTNHHVAGRATRAVCIFSNNEEIEATLVGTDPLTDIAVLKLDNARHPRFPAVDWGDSTAIAVGDTVLAMGSPLALSQSVTRGIVSNAKMIMPSLFRRRGGFALEGEDVGALVRWIAHDAPIYPGNSGGPLVALDGRVIGVNEISLGLGGAIPSNLARAVVDQLIATGRVRRSWLGLEIQPLLKNTGATRGVLVSGVVAGSPAAAAGFQTADCLVQIANQDISVRFQEELPLLNLLIASLPIDQEVTAVVQRAGQEVTLRVRTAEREAPEFKQHELKEWGLTAKNITFLTAKELKLPNRYGALVTTTRAGGPCGAAKPNLESGDVITAVAGTTVRHVADLISITRNLTAEKAAPVPAVVAFLRRGEHWLTVVNVGIQDADDPSAEARKAWLPVAVQVITRELAEQLGTNGVTGVRLTQVYPDTTAAAAGLQVGDLLLAMDGEPIPASQPGDEEHFTNLIRQRRVGSQPEFTLWRAGQVRTQAVELMRAPKVEREMPRVEDLHFEFTARDLSFFDRVRNQLAADTTGVLVTEVKNGGWAALGQLQANDIIQLVDAAPIDDTPALKAKLKEVGEHRPRFVTVRVLRSTRTLFLEFEPDWETGK